MGTYNIPYVKTYVNPSYLGLDTTTWQEGYLFSVTTLLNRPLLFTVHLNSGAVYSRLPLVAFSPVLAGHDKTASECDYWGTIAQDSQVIRFDYLKDYSAFKGGLEGRYLFSIDPIEGAFAEDPEQSKTIHLVEFDNHYQAVANNTVLFKDTHFTNNSEPVPRYKRNSKYFTLG